MARNCLLRQKAPRVKTSSNLFVPFFCDSPVIDMMLSTNVLCMKKRKKKRTYSLSGGKDKGSGVGLANCSRSDAGAVTMLQITEDTPPDMLAGAMDLAVHLPTGRAVKMSVERSTPMMDLLVQITTNHQLQLSNYTLQALGMAPSSEHSDKILPYKPNTPIGTLDTQHIKVIPKSRTLPVPKNVPPGHQPFESTFRLRVHLPRNQLYVTRVSRSVLLEDIMKKVCEEKNLDPMKYELKHPGNLDEALNPKMTLSDYQITEIYVVSKGTVSLNQAFSTSDIMALRKEEERKQMHNKTGGGVLNLIFRRGKSSMGSGSISSDTRSISPTHSDDSRSVTPPGVQQQILSPPKKDPPPDRPKPPQRKRRPAPKPPQLPENSRGNSEESRRDSEESRRNTEDSRRNSEESRRNSEGSRRISEDHRRISEENPASTISEVSELQSRRLENGLVICHSRNSSDSSGYHEASVLSEHCNTSLPRRPKSAFVGSGDMEKMSKLHSHSTTNLSKMSSHSKSTTSLGIPGRKKKAAPPPPPALRASNPAINIETPSLVVASPSAITHEESLTAHQALDSLPSITSTSNILQDVSESETQPFGSTDSGIAPENLEKDPEDFRPITPPPPPAFLDEPLIIPPEVLEEQEKKKFSLPVVSQPSEKAKIKTAVEATVLKEPVIQENHIALNTEDSKQAERLIEAVSADDNEKDKEVADIDWQYQLPSPPKAFRDSSPVNLPDGTTESHSVTDFKDSVVTSPELFEKLKSIEDSQSEKGTITSDLTSVISEEDRAPLMNTLSLEHLERRKSLVYNRELATSLKMSDVETKRGDAETFSSSLTKFEDTFTEMQNSSQRKQVSEPKYVQKTTTASHTHTLPNFKISTYDQPKHKIKVFEDDTIRSNTEDIHKMNRTNTQTSTLNKSYVGRSMENISIRKNSIDEQSSYSNEDKEYRFFMPEKPPPRSFGPLSGVFRSESFSKDNWAPSKPVFRSKSHMTLDAFKYRSERRDSAEEDISRSNSFYDVSGLQSLGVMRMIQHKLSTPTSSMENLYVPDRHQKPFVKSELPKEPPQTSLPMETTKGHQEAIQELLETIEKPSETTEISTEIAEKPPEAITKPPEKTYKYRGPPSINMGTWSDRPKVPVSVKEDADYTLGNVSSKLIVNTTNNSITSNNSIEIKSGTPPSGNNGSDNSVNIKVNGTEPVKQGNVVIKIGNINSQAPKTIDNHRFISHTTAAGYRKPFSTLCKNQRPHSVAFDSDFDISRVPVVRSVELKKPFRDLGNTSVTQLNKEEPLSGLRNKFSGMYRSSETLSSKPYLNHTNGTEEAKETKLAARVSSYKPIMAPVVRGFKTSNESNWSNRLSWNPPGTFNTLPSKPRERNSFATNTQVSFSQSNLRRTDSSKILEKKSVSPNTISDDKFSPSIAMAPPPPPHMPKVTLKKPVVKPVESVMDQRDELLSAIRNFGGKKGLKAAKA